MLKVKNLYFINIMNTKQKLGQFWTTKYKYIFQNMFIPKNATHIIEPFCGEGHLLEFIKPLDLFTECYDIDPKHDFIIKKDSLLDPPDYTNKFIITNPPYLAKNKTKDYDFLYKKYNTNDLYKCFIKNILTNKCIGGIIIIPLNFWSSIRISDIVLRKDFLSVYDIILLNIFEEQVFDDTTYTVCSFQFSPKNTENSSNKINITIYPNKNKLKISLNEDNNYTIGGHIYKLPRKNNYHITRLTSKNVSKKNTNILVNCIDKNKDNKISLTIVPDNKLYIDNTPNLSSRTYATLIIEPSITIEQQKKLTTRFNNFLNKEREKYNSLFLTNYRESKDIARKRISFELVYEIVEYLLDQ
jgi:hypothetical protein